MAYERTLCLILSSSSISVNFCPLFLNGPNILKNLSRRAVLSFPAFPRDRVTGLRILWENAACKTRPCFLGPSVLAVNNVWKHLMTRHNPRFGVSTPRFGGTQLSTSDYSCPFDKFPDTWFEIERQASRLECQILRSEPGYKCCNTLRSGERSGRLEASREVDAANHCSYKIQC